MGEEESRKSNNRYAIEGPDDNAVSFAMALAVLVETDPDTAEIEDYVARGPEPTYGRQIQDFAAAGLPAEAQIRIDWDEVDVPLAGGEVVTLRKPTYTLTGLAYGPLREDVMMSPRIAPQMVGLGLLEAIPEADILSNVDEDDADGNGISGRANFEYSPEHGRVMLGRFGRKASSVTVMHESAAAFSTDVGISNMLFPAAAGDCTPAQAECLGADPGRGLAPPRVERAGVVGEGRVGPARFCVPHEDEAQAPDDDDA